MTLSHFDAEGRPQMVDVGTKPATSRAALAEGSIRMSDKAFEAVAEHRTPKGDVLTTAELAGTMGAKRTPELIPLCHPIPLEYVRVTAELAPELPGVRIRAEARSIGRTGVEMEALTAVAVALLTVYDMVKATGHGMEMGEIRLLEKSGGAKGVWKRT